MHSVTIQVPATSANLGPGYDALGVALQVHNRITVRLSEPRGLAPMPSLAAAAFFETSGLPPFTFDWSIEGEIPQSRGMGSSVTVRLGILHGLNELAGHPLDSDCLFQICARLEGHPDNAAPAAFGGFTVARAGAETLRCEVQPDLHFVLLIPDFEVSTPAARAVLPPSLAHREAAASCANACRITAAFTLQRYDLLRGAFSDGLHQPFRQHLVPMLPDVIAAGEAAGALGGFLSGSGSTICCLTLQNPAAIADAMRAACPSPARTVVTHADNAGTLRLYTT
jgi:homoserine kinase